MESPLCPPPDPGFRLIETMRWSPEEGIARRDLHMARLGSSASRLGISPLGIDALLDDLDAPTPLRVRLTVDAGGRAEVTTAPYQPLPDGTVWRVAMAGDRLNAGDPWLGVKTTQRALYDATRAALPDGVDEVLFLNQRDELCEGTITNVFVDRGQGLDTPPLASGVLPGVLRQDLLMRGDAREVTLTWQDLLDAKAAFVGNSLRGLIPIRLA